MLTLEQQADFVRELPDVFLPVRGGWGRMGATHLRLAKAIEDVLRSALLTADHSGNMHIVEAVQHDALPKS